MINFKNKYSKYKIKYLHLKGGSHGFELIDNDYIKFNFIFMSGDSILSIKVEFDTEYDNYVSNIQDESGIILDIMHTDLIFNLFTTIIHNNTELNNLLYENDNNYNIKLLYGTKIIYNYYDPTNIKKILNIFDNKNQIYDIIIVKEYICKQSLDSIIFLKSLHKDEFNEYDILNGKYYIIDNCSGTFIPISIKNINIIFFSIKQCNLLFEKLSNDLRNNKDLLFNIFGKFNNSYNSEYTIESYVIIPHMTIQLKNDLEFIWEALQIDESISYVLKCQRDITNPDVIKLLNQY